MICHCHGCDRILHEDDVDKTGGPYCHGLPLQNGEGNPVQLVGPRHLIAPGQDPRKVEGYWCGPVDSSEEVE
jgi:hypothetical protein